MHQLRRWIIGWLFYNYIKVNVYSKQFANASLLRDSCAIWDHTVLPATRHRRGDIPAFTPAAN